MCRAVRSRRSRRERRGWWREQPCACLISLFLPCYLLSLCRLAALAFHAVPVSHDALDAVSSLDGDPPASSYTSRGRVDASLAALNAPVALDPKRDLSTTRPQRSGSRRDVAGEGRGERRFGGWAKGGGAKAERTTGGRGGGRQAGRREGKKDRTGELVQREGGAHGRREGGGEGGGLTPPVSVEAAAQARSSLGGANSSGFALPSRHPRFRLALTVPWIGRSFPPWFRYFTASCERSAFLADWLIFHEGASYDHEESLVPLLTPFTKPYAASSNVPTFSPCFLTWISLRGVLFNSLPSSISSRFTHSRSSPSLPSLLRVPLLISSNIARRSLRYPLLDYPSSLHHIHCIATPSLPPPSSSIILLLCW